MDWDDLRYVLAVSRHGTLLGAARALRVNATTVSRRLKALEAGAGAAIFEKLKHGVVLTPAGEEMVRVAESIEELAHGLDARVRGLDGRLEGTLRIASADMIFLLWADDLARFHARYPGIELELLSSYAMVSLTRREADVAVRVASEAPGHLVGRRELEVAYAVYGSRELIARVGEDAPYGAFPWLSWDLRVGRGTDDFVHRSAPGARIVTRVDTVPVMLAGLRAGLGLTILPCLVGDRAPELRRIGDYAVSGTHLWLLTHPELRRTARVRAFMEFFREVARRDAALVEGRSPQAPKPTTPTA
ncbi:MAG: LysR family transcriptional regulator [Myxococcota bacterium]